MNINIMQEKDLPEGFHFPEQYLKAIKLGLVNLTPWHILDAEEARMYLDGMRKLYPNRLLVPFARRYDNDDFACFEKGKGETVQIIHALASVGYEQRQVYDDFWSWFRSAIEDMIDFD